MKKVLLSFCALLFASVVMVSCHKSNSKEVATAWLNAFYHMDYDAAKKLSTKETIDLLSQLQQLSGILPDSARMEVKKTIITIKDVKENGDEATVTYTTSDFKGKIQELKLVKQNDKWLVLFSKSDTMGGADAGGTDQTGADSTGTDGAPSADTNMPDTGKH